MRLAFGCSEEHWARAAVRWHMRSKSAVTSDWVATNGHSIS